jgi:peroxiredoxin
MRQLIQLQKDLGELNEAGLQVVGVSYDSTDVLKQFAEKKKIAYPLLSDVGSKTIDQYGIRNADVKAGSRQDGIPHPGVYLINKDGVVRAKVFFKGYARRATTAELLEAAKSLK